MSDAVNNNNAETTTDSSSSSTERLLLEAAARRNLGLKQEFGVTVKRDGLDGLRAFVWTVFDLSQVVFGVLGVALSLGLLLNLLGYGYYWEQGGGGGGGLVIDTLEHMRQDKIMAAEAVKLAVDVAQKVQQ